jgi:hypothetical protein
MTTVNISETGALQSRGSLANNVSGTIIDNGTYGSSWSYDLPTGSYVFTIDFAGVVGKSVVVTVAGTSPAVAPSTFIIPGTPGTVGADTQDVGFSV